MRHSFVLAFALPPLVAAAQPPTLPSAADAAQWLKAEKVKTGAGIDRLAITSCNVLFGTETSADAETQRGFGDTSQRMEARVYAKYSLLGMSPEALQTLAEQVCEDSRQSFAAAGYIVLPASEVSANPDFVRLHAKGKSVPYAYVHAGSKYINHAPPGEQVIDPVYLNKVHGIGAAFGSMSTEGPLFIEGNLLKSLSASSAHINIMVDFAKPESSNAKGFLGKLSGSDTAKVDANLQLSVSGFVTLHPLSNIDCNNGLCVGFSDASRVPRFATKAPLRSDTNPVLELKDLQTQGEKGGELAVNVLGGLMALAGQGGGSAKISHDGVVVDPAVYSAEVRRLAQRVVGGSAVLSRP